MTRQELWIALEDHGYIAGADTVTTIYLSLAMEKPLLVTGAPGVGKTEIAKVLSRIFRVPLIRLQCYEGLDENKALYEWNYQKQLLHIQMAAADTAALAPGDLFSEDYLLARPLLQAIRADEKVVLLIDEIDKTDEEFEAFLFEVLSDFQVSIPELGTLQANQIPMVVLTSNGERELSDGLKRRCIFLYLDYPDLEKELRIIQAQIPEVPEKLARQAAAALQVIRRELDLRKKPAIAETLDWVRGLLVLDAQELTPGLVGQTTNLLFKEKADLDTFHRQLGEKELCRQVS